MNYCLQYVTRHSFHFLLYNLSLFTNYWLDNISQIFRLLSVVLNCSLQAFSVSVMKDCAEYECSFLRAHELTIHSKSLQQAIFIFSIYQISEKQFWRVLIGSCNSEYPWLCTVWRPGARLSKVPLDNFSGPKSFFMFAVFAFKIKISISLKTIQWNYQLANKTDQFVSLEVC